MRDGRTSLEIEPGLEPAPRLRAAGFALSPERGEPLSDLGSAVSNSVTGGCTCLLSSEVVSRRR
jgi:hypothetical protein